MEIQVTVLIDINDSADELEGTDLGTVNHERRKKILEQTTQNVMAIALKDHFKDCKGIAVGFVKADLVPQS